MVGEGWGKEEEVKMTLRFSLGDEKNSAVTKKREVGV